MERDGMAKFDMKTLMNAQTKAEDATDDAIAFKVELLDIKDLEPSKLNNYSVDDVAELKASIELVGLQHNLVVRRREGAAKYEITSGERRYTALSQLVAEGKEHFRRVPCKVTKSVDDVQAELQLIFANSTARRITGHEMSWQAARLTELLREYRDGGYEMTGKTRDIVAGLLKVSPSQIHRLESIDKNLIPELKEEFKKETIDTTTAYELSRLDEEKQKQALDDMRGGAKLTPRKAKKLHSGAPKPDYEIPVPPVGGKEVRDTMRTEPHLQELPQEAASGAGQSGCVHCHPVRGYDSDFDVKPCGSGDKGINATIHDTASDPSPGIIILQHGTAMGYFLISYCPVCGRSLVR